MYDAVLQPEQLCDLLNWLIGYEQKLQGKFRPEPPINILVVKSWSRQGGHMFNRVQDWCEATLRAGGIRARDYPRCRPGRQISLKPPTPQISRLQSRFWRTLLIQKGFERIQQAQGR